MHTIWLREHNRIASGIAAQGPDLTDEEVYQRARRIVIAEMQVSNYLQGVPDGLGPGLGLLKSGEFPHLVACYHSYQMQKKEDGTSHV